MADQQVENESVPNNNGIKSQSTTAVDPATPAPLISAKKQSLSDVFTIIAAGAALISDGYFNSVMTMVNVLLKKQYPLEFTDAFSTRISNSLFIGAILGQVAIGFTCDYLGRKAAITITSLCLIIGGILAAASHGVTVDGMFWMMVIARGIVGFGVGGEYPASSASASEAANEHALKNRGPIFILVTNLPLSFGGPLAVSIFLVVFMACHEAHYSTVWRVCFALGCVVPLSLFYFRVKMVNSKLYRRGAIKKSVPYGLVLRYYWKSLVGTCGAWFLYDFVTFPNGVFSADIIASVVPSTADSLLKKTAEWQLLLGSLSLPGLFLGAYLCNPLGRKMVMMIGFGGYILFGLIIGLAYEKITGILPLFVVMYGLMESSGNMGPGNMLGLISSETYATSVRGTCYGISAAIGKVGAAVGVEAFKPIQQNLGKKWTFIIAAICGLAGIAVTYFFIEDPTGEDLSYRDQRFRAYLVENNWTGEMGEDDMKGLATDGQNPGDGVDIEAIREDSTATGAIKQPQAVTMVL